MEIEGKSVVVEGSGENQCSRAAVRVNSSGYEFGVDDDGEGGGLVFMTCPSEAWRVAASGLLFEPSTKREGGELTIRWIFYFCFFRFLKVLAFWWRREV